MWTPRNEAVGAFAIVRARLEQRVRPGPSRDVGLRGRVMLRAHARIPAEPRLVVVLWQELFVGLTATDWGQPLGVDQTRSFLGVGWQLRPDTARLELGYTNVWAVRPGADAVAHVLAINGFFGWPSGA